jgi:predicted nucleic acid-binding protein
MTVLVDSSVWIDYFRSGKNSGNLDSLIDENIVATNDLILTEMVPYLKLRKQRKIVGLLNTIERAKLDIRWDQLIDWQYQCLMQGLNGIGIPDLIIAQNAVQNNCALYSLDSHFKLIEMIVKIELY